jgi:hypothetical protein
MIIEGIFIATFQSSDMRFDANKLLKQMEYRIKESEAFPITKDEYDNGEGQTAYAIDVDENWTYTYQDKEERDSDFNELVEAYKHIEQTIMYEIDDLTPARQREVYEEYIKNNTVSEEEYPFESFKIECRENWWEFTP